MTDYLNALTLSGLAIIALSTIALIVLTILDLRSKK
jgi:hypothetical protein